MTYAMRRSADLSPCGSYRWWLRRTWPGGNGEVVCFIMLNPSTADASVDDPTIRRCLGFARDWGYSTLSVRNLFPYRATDPRQIVTAAEPTGGRRGDTELLTGLTAHRVVLAWGSSVPFQRDTQVLALFRQCRPDVPLWCLGRTKTGKPRHPLYCRSDMPLVLFEEPAS